MQEGTVLFLLLVCLGLHINFSKSDFCLNHHFRFLGLCLDMLGMCVFMPSDKLDEIWQLAHSLLQTQPVTVCEVMSFLGKAIFYDSGHSQL